MSESKFELQLIKVNQESDQDLTQILLIFNSDSKQELKVNENLIKEINFI